MGSAMVLSKCCAPLPEVVLRGRAGGEAAEVALDQVPGRNSLSDRIYHITAFHTRGYSFGLVGLVSHFRPRGPFILGYLGMPYAATAKFYANQVKAAC